MAWRPVNNNGKKREKYLVTNSILYVTLVEEENNDRHGENKQQKEVGLKLRACGGLHSRG